MNASQRVRAYIAEFDTCWGATAKEFSHEVDFEVWRTRVSTLESRHFAPGSSSGAARSFSRIPPHPADEVIISSREEGDHAFIGTNVPSATPVAHNLYQLVRRHADWLITAVESFTTDPFAPLVSRESREKLLAEARNDAVLKSLPPGVNPNGDALFCDGRQIRRDQGETTIVVRQLGSISIASGIIGVVDLGIADEYTLHPLERRVTPGNYPVEIAIAYDRVAALRVRFRDEPSLSWHPANRTGGGHGVGVDTGSVALVDFASALTLTPFEQNRVVRRLWSSEYPARASLTSIAGNLDCVLCDSGWGDGAYPCTWGVNQDGNLVSLMVDFFVAVETLQETVRLGWTMDDAGTPLCHPLLEKHGVSVVLDEPKKGVAEARMAGAKGLHAQLYSAGHPVGAGGSSFVEGDCRVVTWKCDLLELGDIELVVTLKLGYRN